MTSSSPSRGFSLIELLVVISIITLLIALLLPALGAAKRMTIRLNCAQRIRALGQSSMQFGMDHADRVPRGMSNWAASGDTTLDEYARYLTTSGNTPVTSTLYSDHLTAMGGLAVMNYVADPNDLYCPTVQQGSPPDPWMTGAKFNSIQLWHGNRPIWKRLVEEQDATGLPEHPQVFPKAGYSHYFYVFRGPMSSGYVPGVHAPYDHGHVPNLTFDEIVTRHDRPTYTPLIHTCANDHPPNDAGIHKGHRSHINPSTGQNAGVNGAFVDGSVRWVSRNETMRIFADLKKNYSNPGTWREDRITMNGSHKHAWFEFIARNGLELSGQ
jgi:prepilin-type N-terminal cleavage/methylation domain-containing protein